MAQSKLNLSCEDRLSAMPRGYAEHADAWFADYLKLQSFIVRRDLTKKGWLSGAVVEEAVSLTLSAESLIEFGRRS